MTLVFYPSPDDVEAGTLNEKLDVLMDAAQRYKGAVLDPGQEDISQEKKQMSPRDIKIAYNWQEIAKILREVRDLPEGNSAAKKNKIACLMKLTEIYETLRASKMPKLESIRLSLANEVAQLQDGGES
jgi:hypothetical protein